MPAKDRYHQNVVRALIKDGWTITHDPLRLTWRGRELYVDLGVEQFIAAIKGTQKIGIEIKSFIGHSAMDDLEKAVGQYRVYYRVLQQKEPDRILYLAVPKDIWKSLFKTSVGELMLESGEVKVVAVDMEKEEIFEWQK